MTDMHELLYREGFTLEPKNAEIIKAAVMVIKINPKIKLELLSDAGTWLRSSHTDRQTGRVLSKGLCPPSILRTSRKMCLQTNT